jgi:peptidoglycan hydrolase-like protein with peptidoglycan-binding domain
MRSFSISNLTSKVLLAALIFTFNIISVGFVQAQTFDFYRSLKVGDEGQDVLILQKILNQDPDTRIAQSGIGSLGNETTYFGNLTKNAVIKFQNKYRNEVLVPAGLSVGTGYFGPSTMTFLEANLYSSEEIKNKQVIQTSKSFDELMVEVVASRKRVEQSSSKNSNETNNNYVEVENTQSQNTNPGSIIDQSKLVRSSSMEVYFVSQNVFETGTELTVVGTGINKDSEIYFFNFENDKVVNSIKIDSNFIFFDAPNLPDGKYELYIKNGNLISKPLVVEIVSDYNPPTISSVSPSSISYGDVVTIKGFNFENQNTVMTALGTYQTSSNGSEIKFTVSRFANLQTNEVIVSPKEQKKEGVIQVQNSNGVSDAKLVDFIYN